MRVRTIMLPAIGLISAAIIFSFFPWGQVSASEPTGAPLLEGTTVPAEVRQVLETKCADCHSQNTHLPFYGKIPPASWLIERDIHEGRQHLNLSQWQQYDTASQIDLLAKIASEARSGEMPLKQYLILHPQARLTSDEQQLLYDWAKSERKRLKRQLPTPQN